MNFSQDADGIIIELYAWLSQNLHRTRDINFPEPRLNSIWISDRVLSTILMKFTQNPGRDFCSILFRMLNAATKYHSQFININKNLRICFEARGIELKIKIARCIKQISARKLIKAPEFYSNFQNARIWLQISVYQSEL